MTAPSSLSITPNESGFAVSGEIDAHSAPALADALADRTDDIVVLDLSAVDFVDSSGLRVLIEAHQAATKSGRTFQLAHPSGPVNRLLEISGVSDYLNVVS